MGGRKSHFKLVKVVIVCTISNSTDTKGTCTGVEDKKSYLDMHTQVRIHGTSVHVELKS